MIKKILFSVGLCCTLCGWANAQTLSIPFMGLDLTLPFQQVKASQLYDFNAGRGFAAIETDLVTRGDGALVFGGATSTAGGPAFPYAGLNFQLPSPPFDTSNNDLLFGVWIGRDFGARENFYGIKGSLELW